MLRRDRVWTMPAYGPDGVRRRGGAILSRPYVELRNLLRRRCRRRPKPEGEADGSEALSRDGAVRSNVETAAMAEERRTASSQRAKEINRATGRNLP